MTMVKVSPTLPPLPPTLMLLPTFPVPLPNKFFNTKNRPIYLKDVSFRFQKNGRLILNNLSF